VPEHGHRGHETVCVLAGSYSDRLGRFGPGDLAEADAEVEHQPVADAGQDCICLIATTAPLRFHGRAARLLQPVLGF
jgi:putative transcriptional regulator